MNETPPYNDSIHQTILRKISRLRGLTIASVALNGLILFLFLLACVAHHHHQKHHHGFGGCPMEKHEGGQFHRDGGLNQAGDSKGPNQGNFDRSAGGPRDFQRGPDGDGKRQPPTPEEMSTRMLDHIDKQVTLTDDEKAKIKPMLLDQATQMQKDREAQHAQMKKAMDDTKAKIRTLLTPDQQKQLDQAEQEQAGDKPEAGASPQQ